MKTTIQKKTLSPLLQIFKQLTQEKAKLFYIVDSLAIKEPRFSLDTYLKTAFLVLDAFDQSFILDREETFFFDLIKQITIFQSSTQSQVHTLTHTVAYPFQSKEVVGILLYFHEVDFQNLPSLDTLKKTLLQNLPNFYLVEGASSRLIQGDKPHITLYLEAQKIKGSFINKEIASLQKLFLHIVQEDFKPSPPFVIVPSNRELLFKSFRETLNSLQKEDIPQVIIDFNNQIKEVLSFSALVCQVKHTNDISLQSRLKHPSIEIEGIMTFQEKTLLKEGIILSIQISSPTSFPVISGRIEAAALIQSLIGPFRDLNGGLLEKTMETFHLLEKTTKASTESLKRFFYSITPQEAQATTPISLLKALYFSLKKQENSKEETHYHCEKTKEGICITLKTSDLYFKKAFKRFLYSHASSPIFLTENAHTATIIGCIIKMKEGDSRKHLQKEIECFYHQWFEKKELKQILRLSTNSEFSSLDPRIGTNESTSYLHKMLFEGLMRIGKEGSPELAIAEKVEKLDSGKCYRFFLKTTFWSNGMPLTAHDFVYSWQTSLLPHCLSPLSYLFFSIENGRAIKEGKQSVDRLGVQALDDLTLEVRLNAPIPYFLGLCCCSVFSPICSKIDREHPSWPYSDGDAYVCNGPFALERYHKGKQLILKKNPFYWEAKKVRLEKILIAIHSPKESSEQFKEGKIDALLHPWYRQKPQTILTDSSIKQVQGAPWMCYLHINSTQPPFHNRKIRQALSLALDRHILARFYSEDAIPTYSLYHPAFSQVEIDKEENKLLALKRLIEGLEEEGMQLRDIQEETFYSSQVNEPFALLILKQLKVSLHLKWKLLVLDSSQENISFWNKEITAHFYWWFNRVEDPSYFLEAFSSKENAGYHRFWTNDRLQNIIYAIRKETDLKKRNILHQEAETLLNKEKPFIPLFYVPILSYFQSNIHNIYSPPSEYFDLRHSYKT